MNEYNNPAIKFPVIQFNEEELKILDGLLRSLLRRKSTEVPAGLNPSSLDSFQMIENLSFKFKRALKEINQ